MKIQGVIFDMDGLVFDTEKLATWSIQELGKRRGVDYRAGMPDLMGVNASVAERAYKKRFGEEFDYWDYRAERQKLVDLYIKENGLPKKRGLDELLTFLQSQKIPMALGTSCEEKLVKRYLEIAGITSYFSVVICGNMVEKSKPDPEIFLTAASKLGTEPGNTLVLEDSYHGIRAAHAGGFLSCMVPDLQPVTEEMRKLSNWQMQNLGEIIPLIQKNI